MKLKVLIAMIATSGIALLGSPPSPASASDATPIYAQGTVAEGGQPTGLCEGGRVVYHSHIAKTTFTRAKGRNSAVTGDPGTTLTISTSTTFSVNDSINTSAQVSASAAVASVSATVGTTVGAGYSATSSSSGAWTVPSNYKIGRLEIGTNKYKGTTTRYIEQGNCSLRKSGNPAYYDIPAKEWHFKTSRVS